MCMVKNKIVPNVFWRIMWSGKMFDIKTGLSLMSFRVTNIKYVCFAWVYKIGSCYPCYVFKKYVYLPMKESISKSYEMCS